MNRFESITKPMMWSTTILLAAFMAGCGGSGDGIPIAPIASACTGSSCVSLGTAANYVVFANTGIHTDAGASVITGNIGTGPGVTSSAITGFALNLPAASPFASSAQVNGRVYAFDYAPPTPTSVNTASNDMGTAYTAAANKPAGVGPKLNLGGGTVTGQTLAAGTYTWTSAVNIPTDLTLNGSATDVWVFQIAGTLDMAAAKKVILTGGALPQNVFWQVSGAVTIGANTQFKGNILGQTSITFGNSSSIDGRLLAQTAVTLDTTTVTQP
jgi:hypothetical protein